MFSPLGANLPLCVPPGISKRKLNKKSIGIINTELHGKFEVGKGKIAPKFSPKIGSEAGSIKEIGYLLGVEDTGRIKQNTASQTCCFYCFSRSFLLLSPMVLHQVGLLNQV